MCRPRGATREELTFKTDGAVATIDIQFDNWNSSRRSLSISPTLQFNKMQLKQSKVPAFLCSDILQNKLKKN
jgi:hypothetical protein